MRHARRVLAGAAITAIAAIALAMLEPAANAQILPSSTTTTTERPRSTTTTTALVPSTTAVPTTTTSAPATTTTATATPATTAPRRATTTTTAPGPTTTAFVPPEGVPAGPTTTVPADGPLEADLGMLPFFVTLSLGGFAIALAILAVQWVRTRP